MFLEETFLQFGPEHLGREKGFGDEIPVVVSAESNEKAVRFLPVRIIETEERASEPIAGKAVSEVLGGNRRHRMGLIETEKILGKKNPRVLFIASRSGTQEGEKKAVIDHNHVGPGDPFSSASIEAGLGGTVSAITGCAICVDPLPDGFQRRGLEVAF